MRTYANRGKEDHVMQTFAYKILKGLSRSSKRKWNVQKLWLKVEKD